jgi:hypothetical protein
VRVNRQRAFVGVVLAFGGSFGGGFGGGGGGGGGAGGGF